MVVEIPSHWRSEGEGRRVVLVVDDDVDSAVTVSELLRWIGHEVRVAHDGDGALRLAEEVRPDLVVLDIGLPDRSGYEVARMLRDRFGREITLIALSGWTPPGYLVRSRAAGFDRFVVKPTSLAELREILADVDARLRR